MKLVVEWEYEQDNDREIALVKMAVRSKDENILQDTTDSKIWCQNFSNFQIENGILKCRNRGGNLVIVAPRNLWSKISSVYHDTISSGHLSFEKTFRSIASRFIWPQFHIYILDFCMTCDICQKFKQSTRKPNRHPLFSIKINKIWDLICVDVVGPLKVTIRGNRFIIIAIDHFSKFVIARAVPRYTAEITTTFLKEDLINKFGVPQAWLTDQGRNFEVEIFSQFCNSYSIGDYGLPSSMQWTCRANNQDN